MESQCHRRCLELPPLFLTAATPASTPPGAAGAVWSPRNKPSFLRFLEAAFEAPFPRAEAPLSLFPERSPLSTGRDGLRKSCLEAKRFQKVRSGGCPPRGRAGAAGAGCPRAELLLGARVRSAAAVTPLFPSAATGSVLRDRDFISLSLDFSARPGAREQRHRRFLPPPEGGSGTKLHDPPYAAAAGPRGRALLLHGAPAACCAAAGLGNC